MAEEKTESPGLFSNKKPVSSAIKKFAKKIDSSEKTDKISDTDSETKQPSRFTRAEGALKKRLGAGKAEMLLERTDREKIVELFDREQQPEPEAVPEEVK